MYNCSGTVSHHNVDLWGDSAPQDNYLSSTFWPMGATWLITHVIEHYRFTGDAAMLQKMYPALKANAEFALDFLTPWGEYMVTNPSISPENIYYAPNASKQQVSITAGPTIDNTLLWELFGFILEAQEALGITNDTAFADQVTTMRAKLPPLRLNQYDGIAEWIENYEEVSLAPFGHCIRTRGHSLMGSTITGFARHRPHVSSRGSLSSRTDYGVQHDYIQCCIDQFEPSPRVSPKIIPPA